LTGTYGGNLLEFESKIKAAKSAVQWKMNAQKTSTAYTLALAVMPQDR
jgi:hypothetical protein